MDEGLKGWMAGFLDGEGGISISKGYPSASQTQYALNVVLTCSELTALEKFHATFKGHIHTLPSSRKSNVPLKKPSYQWALHGAKASNFLQEILPYLVLKRPQAEVSIEFQKTIRGKPISEDIWKRREELYDKMKVLNMRGKGRGQKRISRKSRKRRKGG